MITSSISDGISFENYAVSKLKHTILENFQIANCTNNIGRENPESGFSSEGFRIFQSQEAGLSLKSLKNRKFIFQFFQENFSGKFF